MYDMYYYEVAPLQIIRKGQFAFTYESAIELSRGHIVKIEAGKKQYVGVVLGRVSKPTFYTKNIIGVVTETALPTELIETAEWISSYYGTHLSHVLQMMLPSGVEKHRRNNASRQSRRSSRKIKFELNKRQQEAVNIISGNTPNKTIVLHGVTGSGKTLVYIEAAKQALQKNKSVIILVPEIALTSQVIDEFSLYFNDVIFTHSQQTEAERHRAWMTALESNTPRVVIGPRSALFLPLNKVGLIVIDEFHEPSYKQEQSPRYSALRTARVIAGLHGANLVLGSATPSVQDYYLAKESHSPIIEIDQTAKESRPPELTVVDITKKQYFTKHRFLSDELLSKIESCILGGKQVLIFHNRRGSAQITLCESCGWSALCPNCHLPLTLHTDSYLLICHLCNKKLKLPTSCPVCKNTNIVHRGIGTKLIELELKKLFPKINIARFDGDNTTENRLDNRYNDIHEGKINIIIGTQVVAKGLDLPHLRLVGIVQADTGLYMPDYSANERTFQLLAQAVGRVGRSNHETSVVVQSYSPKDRAVRYGLSQNFAAYYQEEIKDRKRKNFPPFIFLLKLTCAYKTEETSIKHAKLLVQRLASKYTNAIEIFGPTPSFHERKNGSYKWQIVVKAKKRSILMDAIHEVPTKNWQFEIDPTSLL
jgi:primosomal protein N' (replication factor Y)